MTSSDNHIQQRAENVISEITSSLNESYLISHIDEPIDHAVASFRWRQRPHYSHRWSNQILARFVAHLYGNGLPCPRQLSASQAYDEAVSLLEHIYEGTHANGYFAAVLDAAHAQPNGMELVLVRLAEAIKAKWRQMHVRWVFARALDPSDWALRCEIAAVLLDHLRSWLPEEMSHCHPSQFADDIPTLLSQYLDVDGQFGQVSSGSNSIWS